MKKGVAYCVLGLGAVGLCVVAYFSAGLKGVYVFVGVCVFVIAIVWAVDVIGF